MRALVNQRAGGPETLIVEDRPEPTPQPTEVRIAVKRAGLNFADISARVGLYPDAPKFPMVMGYEVSGVVDQLGSAVTSLKVGDRVTAMCRFGGQASSHCVPATQVRRMPDAMSFDEGAALPVNYLTAYQMLFWVAPLQPQMTILIHMAAGGVGLAAIQLAKTVPNVTTIGTSSASKHAFLKAQGLHHAIDYRTQDYVAEVKRLTDGKGVDRVLDALGGKDWQRGYSVLRSGGTLLAFGWANMVDGATRNLLTVVRQLVSLKKWSPMQHMDVNRGVSGVNLGHLWHEGERMGSHLDALLGLYERGSIKPHVDSVFPLSKAGDAHAHVQARKNVGKVLLDPEA